MEDNIITTIGRKILSAVLGLAIGAIYGLVLSPVAAKVFIVIFNLRFDHNPGSKIYYSSGQMVAILYAIVGTALFSGVFGRLSIRLVRMMIGAILGIILGAHIGYTFLYVPCVNEFGESLFILYTAIWGAIGGLLVALTIRRILGLTVYKYEAIKVDLNPATSGIWSAIVGGIFALSVALLSLSVNKGFWDSKKENLYVVVYSSNNKAEAINYATQKINSDYSPEIYFTANGNYAVTIGYYEPEKAKNVKDNAVQNGSISPSSYLIGSKGIIKKVYP